MSRLTNEERDRIKNEDLLGFIADFGGTNARFCIVKNNGELDLASKYSVDKYGSIVDIIKEYFDYVYKHSRISKIKNGAICIACPVLGDEVHFTNNSWTFSISNVQKALELDTLTVVNDFVAQALGVLKTPDIEVIYEGKKTIEENIRNNSPVGVIGPGTGLGVSILIPTQNDYIALPTEGGHATICASNEVEFQIIERLRKLYGHISAERVISGKGLENIYAVLTYTQDEKVMPAAKITENASKGDKMCLIAVNIMFDFLASFASNLALTCGAFGGIYLAGGILAHENVFKLFKESNFLNRYFEKGRFKSYMEQIPVYCATGENPAMYGLQAILKKNAKN
ncbi:MAG: glucokinase [Alphaproteobacteria bacterium]|nr:glucokinase [Alphaproteobacteria bacterium]